VEKKSLGGMREELEPEDEGPRTRLRQGDVLDAMTTALRRDVGGAGTGAGLTGGTLTGGARKEHAVTRPSSGSTHKARPERF